MSKLLITFFFSFLFITNLLSQEKNQITYIANEGIFIEYGGKKILIDALHAPYTPLYQPTRNPFPHNMKNGIVPFDGIDLLMVTHLHGDHFNAAFTTEFLENHEESILVAPEQVIDTMGNVAYLTGQIYAVSKKDKGVTYEMDGLKIHVFPLIHSYPQKNHWIDNMAYLLDFEGVTILHVGDAEFLPENLNRIQKSYWKRSGLYIIARLVFCGQRNDCTSA